MYRFMLHHIVYIIVFPIKILLFNFSYNYLYIVYILIRQRKTNLFIS